ncbi:hypothetical protein [Parvicella tangerina]|nr:hypothetical protein [Parvicella tangerina]
MRSVLSILVFAFVLSACNSNGTSEAQEEINSYLSSIDKETTPEEYEQLKKDVSNYFYEGRLEDINKYVDYRALISITLDKMDLEGIKIEFFDAMTEELAKRGDYWESTSWGTSYYDCVKEYMNEDGHSVLVFRSFGDAGINYDEFVLAKVEGEVKIIDIFNVGNGQFLSEIMREFVTNLMNSKNKNLDPKESELLMEDIVDDIQYEDYESALEKYQLLPTELKQTRVMKLMELRLYMWLDEEVYAEKVDAYRASYPHDACLDLMLIDYYTIKEDYEMTIESIKAIEEVYPDDGVLDFYKGGYYLEMNDCQSALNAFNNAVLSDDEIYDFKDGLSIAYIDCDQKEKGFAMVDELIDLGYYSYSDFDYYLSISYDNYTSWPAYQKWISQYDTINSSSL